MTQQDKEQLKLEIDHIFESGANEIRIFEMVVNFMDSRNGVNKNFVLADVSRSANTDEYTKGYRDGGVIAVKTKRSLINLSVGQVVTVGIAHTFQKHYGWSDYSESNYIIEKISRKEIIGRSERYSHEGIRISRKDLDSGRFELRI